MLVTVPKAHLISSCALLRDDFLCSSQRFAIADIFKVPKAHLISSCTLLRDDFLCSSQRFAIADIFTVPKAHYFRPILCCGRIFALVTTYLFCQRLSKCTSLSFRRGALLSLSERMGF